MAWVSLLACIAVLSMGAGLSATIRLLRAQQREAQRRESELLNRIMFLVDRPWVDAPSQVSTQPEVAPSGADVISWPEAMVDSN